MNKKNIAFCVVLMFLPLFLSYSQDSHSSQQEVLATQESLKEAKEYSDPLLAYLKVLLGPIVALIGIVMGYPLLKKKLTENHISSSLNKIQIANSEIQKENQKLMDLYFPLQHKNDFIAYEEIQSAYEDIQKIYGQSLDGSSDVATMMFYLKSTLEYVLRNFPTANEHIYKSDFYEFIIDVLELTNFFSTQAIQIPRSSRIVKHPIIKKSLHPFVLHSHILKYKHFSRGVIENPDTVHHLRFIEEVIHSRLKLLMRSAFQVKWHPNTIAKLLYINNFYAPPILRAKSISVFMGEYLNFFLVGFSLGTEIGGKEVKKYVNLIYSNLSNSVAFVESMRKEEFVSVYKDNWLLESGFTFTNVQNFSKPGYEVVQVKMDREYLEEAYGQNKYLIKQKLKINTGI